MKTLVVAVLTVALAACGSKAKKDTTPTKTDPAAGSSTGGASYGSAAPAPAKADSTGGGY